jgi:hypothetical protein
VLTGKIATKTHPNSDDISWKAVPWMRETIKSNCDLACFTQKIKEEFPDLDVSDCEDPIWFLRDVFVPAESGVDHQAKMIAAWEEKPDVQSLIDYMQSISPERIESPWQAYQRAQRAKQEVAKEIKKFVEENGAQSEIQILLVAHSNFLRNFTASGFNQENQTLVDPIRFQNAEINEFEFNLTQAQ